MRLTPIILSDYLTGDEGRTLARGLTGIQLYDITRLL